MEIIYQYAFFFEDGTQEKFHLHYGPEHPDNIIYDYRESPHLQRFAKEMMESDGIDVFEIFDQLHEKHSFGFCIVNPPREKDW